MGTGLEVLGTAGLWSPSLGEMLPASPHRVPGTEGDIQPAWGRRCPIPRASRDTHHSPTDSPHGLTPRTHPTDSPHRLTPRTHPTAPGPSAAAAGSAQTLPQVETKAAGPCPLSPVPRQLGATALNEGTRAVGSGAAHTHTHRTLTLPLPLPLRSPRLWGSWGFLGGSPVPMVLPAPAVGLGGSQAQPPQDSHPAKCLGRMWVSPGAFVP